MRGRQRAGQPGGKVLRSFQVVKADGQLNLYLDRLASPGTMVTCMRENYDAPALL